MRLNVLPRAGAGKQSGYHSKTFSEQVPLQGQEGYCYQ